MWLIALLVTEALGCGGPTDTRVVGWSADGTLALVRFEEQNEQERLHDLRLELVDLAARGRERTWTILEPQDDGDAALRGARWKAAEPEIAASGIALQPELAPSFEFELGRPVVWTLPGKDYELQVQDYSYDSASMRRWELHARRGDRDVVVSVLLETSNSGVPFNVGRVYVNPQATHLVLTDRDATIQKAIPIEVAAIEAALGS